jgi:hypothetical protein
MSNLPVRRSRVFLNALFHLSSNISITSNISTSFSTMHTLSLLTLVLPTFLAAAHEFPPWAPPFETDVRSPCPALNTLANHNLIPHSGRNLSSPMLQKILGSTYNIGLNISTVFAIGGLLASPNHSVALSTCRTSRSTISSSTMQVCHVLISQSMGMQ